MMASLTLGECLIQERGTEGRLFELDDNNPEARRARLAIPDSQGFVGAYSVLEVRGDVMRIEGYMRGGSRKVFDNVPIELRRGDSVMDADSLMEWYIMAGRVGSCFPNAP